MDFLSSDSILDNLDPSAFKRIPLEYIQDAHRRMDGRFRTPLMPLSLQPDASKQKIHLKMENLQPVGSFKVRGAWNAIDLIPPRELTGGVASPSAGNFALGVAYSAKAKHLPCKIIVPQTAPQIKVDAIERYGGEVIKVPYDDWWKVMMTGQTSLTDDYFIHPVRDTRVIAGQGTIGLEILESLPEVDAIIVPYGGGGIATGVASAVKALKPSVKIYACEVETASPLTASRQLGKPTTAPNHRPSFVDGMGGKAVFEGMWNLASNLIDEVIVLTLQEIVDAIKLVLERNHVVVEGAGAATVAAALTGKVDGKNVVCVLSGGNIDTANLIQTLQGRIPRLEDSKL